MKKVEDKVKHLLSLTFSFTYVSLWQWQWHVHTRMCSRTKTCCLPLSVYL